MRYVVWFGLVFLSVQSLALEPKGAYWPCKAGKVCTSLQTNPQNTQKIAGIKPADITIAYRYSRAGLNGKLKTLEPQQVLHSGDEFVIDVRFHQPRCLYLMHYDSHQQLRELLSLSQVENCQSGKGSMTLPSKNQHFTLDKGKGLETIHAIVSAKPLPNLLVDYEKKWTEDVLMARFPKALAVNLRLSHETKGFFVQDDHRSTVACLSDLGVCRDVFVFEHR